MKLGLGTRRSRLVIMSLLIGAIGIGWFLVAVISLATQPLGDRFGPDTVIRNDYPSAVVLAICDRRVPSRSCVWIMLDGRTTTTIPVTSLTANVKVEQFDGRVTALTPGCALLAQSSFQSDGGDFVIYVGDQGVSFKTTTNGYGELNPIGYGHSSWWPPASPCPSVPVQ